MKRRLFIAFVCFTLLIGSVYIFIPNVINIASVVGIKVTRNGLYRTLVDKEMLAKCWPEKVQNDSFYFNNFLYKVDKNNLTVIPIGISNNTTNLSTRLFLTSVNIDSTNLQWNAEMVTSNNPYKRIRTYLKAITLKKSMNAILQKVKYFSSDIKNIYGFDIRNELVKDSILITTSGKSIGYPTNQFIYNSIGKLKNYAITNNATETGFPMLNIERFDSVTFFVKVALPIDKVLKPSLNIFPKRMLGRGNILVTEVKGGIFATTKAMEQILKYGDDYQRSSPAIPFYSLISNRFTETDSSKWITKIYFPVM